MSNNDFIEIALTNDPRATVGELFVYGLLKRHLPSDCELYFQPHIHSKQRADILVLRKNYGAALLEIKDWIPELYKLEAGKDVVKVVSTGSIIRNPAEQVKAYKNGIYEACGLVIDTLFNPKIYRVIKTFVIYTNSLAPPEKSNYTSIISRKYLLENQQDLVRVFGLDRKEPCYTEDIHDRIAHQVARRVLPQHPIVFLKQGARQQTALALPDNNRRKIMGPAGSGKTTIALAACRSWSSEGKSVLVLVYTRSMRNHYRYLIDHLDGEFERTKIHVMTFNKWVRDVLSEIVDSELVADVKLYSKLIHAMDIKGDAEAETTSNNETIDYLQEVGSITDRMYYDCLIIDEAQDFAKEWMVLAERFAKVNGGKYLVLADEVQNVFGRVKDLEGKVNTNIAGEWFRLEKVYRNQGSIFKYCNEYRKLVAPTDSYSKHTASLEYDNEQVSYQRVADNPIPRAIELFKRRRRDTADESIAIIANRRQTLTIIADKLSGEYNLNRMVETSEERLSLLRLSFETVVNELTKSKAIQPDDKHIENIRSSVNRLELTYRQDFDDYEQMRRARQLPDKPTIGDAKYLILRKYTTLMQYLNANLKSQFHATAGRLILCTVQSLKGQQVDHVIYIHDSTNELNNELIYTAITRARKSLTVIDTMSDQLLLEAYENALKQ